MKNLLSKVATATKNTSVNVASRGLGAIHFIGQTIADVAMETEAAIKLKADGVSKQDTKQERVLQTLAYQQSIIDTYDQSITGFQLMRDRLLKRGLFNEEVITINVQEITSEDLQTI